MGLASNITINSLLARSNANCSETNSAKVATILLQEGSAYELAYALDGSSLYTFDGSYITRLVDTISSGMYASFSKVEKQLTDDYLAFRVDNTTPSAVVVALDTVIGEL